ncbi:MAG: hypothetical protein KGQ70_09295 [Alphaproteobacteria bacterium]|nr:hypothetical protein [Alphaproteobacteria bacterium]
MRVYETSATEGAGPLQLHHQTGSRSFYSAFGANGAADAFLYLVQHRDLNEWEAGTGHLADAGTLVRDTVIASSNADAAVPFSAGVKDITNDIYEGAYDAR